MAENFGGPVWHASAQDPRGMRGSLELALLALRGVGDASEGEWIEPGSRGTIMHAQRRLSEAEGERVGPLRDLRGSLEEHSRLKALDTLNEEHKGKR